MQEKPILFSTAMVQAILDGRKTQTRRVVKPQPEETRAKGKEVIQVSDYCTGAPEKGQAYYWKHNGAWNGSESFKCPYGKVGDLLWVRETWCLTQPTHPESYHFGYKAGGIMPYSDWEASEKYDYATPDQWKPSIHMPKEAARIWLRITDVRVERLHEITEDDAVKEGVMSLKPTELMKNTQLCCHSDFTEYWTRPLNRWKSLWQSINGTDSWSANPWVWVIEFEVVSITGRP
jgi:hypothetical protein